MRLIAFGDIHGMDHYLRLILESIEPQPDDHLVFLGDYIDRGPNSAGVLDLIMETAEKCHVHTVMGNHEEMFLGAYHGGASDQRFWCQFGGIAALQSFKASNAREVSYKYRQFMTDCLPYYETENHIFVHAGCEPYIPLDQNSGKVLRWIGNYLGDSVPHNTGKTVVCGHVTQRKVLDLGCKIGIDTGSGVLASGRLTALDVNSYTMWQAGGRNKKATVKKLR